jgi:hypothetical protein
MNDNEREAIERELERETRFLQRQELMKQLWRLSNNSLPPRKVEKPTTTTDAGQNTRPSGLSREPTTA